MENNRQAREELQRLEAERVFERGNATKRVIFDGLPAGLAIATTDADGKFTLRLPANTPVVLAAHSSREVGNTTEDYY